MIISLIAAVAENNVIGNDNDLIWHLPNDMRYFMETTKGHCVLMGRRNYDSIPEKYRPLKGRTNIVVTRQKNYQVSDSVIVVNTIEEGIEIAKNKHEEELFVIGGGEIYLQTINLADRLYLTEIKAKFDGDTYFPEFDREEWHEVSRRHHLIDDSHEYCFDYVIWERLVNIQGNQSNSSEEVGRATN